MFIIALHFFKFAVISSAYISMFYTIFIMSFMLVVIVTCYVTVVEEMDLRRVKDEDKLDLCRKYFYGICSSLLSTLVSSCEQCVVRTSSW